MIIVTQYGRSMKVAPVPFPSEDALQQYVAANPGVIPLGAAPGARELHILGREFPTASGPVDVLGTDVNGNAYLIETKLHKNPDKRRVLAQVLDYGAALWAAPPSAAQLVERLRLGAVSQNASDPIAELAIFLDSDEAAANAHLARVGESLANGRFTAVVLMDHLSERLKDLILFINANSTFRCWAVELEYYRHGDAEIAYPKLFGAEGPGSASGGTATSATVSPEQYLARYAEQYGAAALEQWRSVVEAALSLPGVAASHLPAGTPYVYLTDTPVGDVRLFRLADGGTEIRDLLHQAKAFAERPELQSARDQLRSGLVSRVPGAAVRGTAGRVYIPLAAAAERAGVVTEELARFEAAIRSASVEVVSGSGA